MLFKAAGSGKTLGEGDLRTLAWRQGQAGPKGHGKRSRGSERSPGRFWPVGRGPCRLGEGAGLQSEGEGEPLGHLEQRSDVIGLTIPRE